MEERKSESERHFVWARLLLTGGATESKGSVHS